MKNLKCYSPAPSTCVYAMANIPNKPYIICVNKEKWKQCKYVKEHILNELFNSYTFKNITLFNKNFKNSKIILENVKVINSSFEGCNIIVKKRSTFERNLISNSIICAY